MSHIRCNCKTPNYNPIGRCLSCGGFHEGDTQMTNNTNPAPQLPVDVVKEIKSKAIDYASGIVFNSAWMNAEKISEKRTEASVDYQAGATEYATKLHQVEKERDELRQWKIEAVELQIPIIAYVHKHLECNVGDSCTALVIAELDRLRVENEKLKEQATGWRPLLEKVIHRHEGGLLPDRILYLEIKTFLYGE